MGAAKGKTQTHTETTSAIRFENPVGVANFAIGHGDTHAIFAIPPANFADLSKCF